MNDRPQEPNPVDQPEATPQSDAQPLEVEMPPLTVVILALENKELIAQTVQSIGAFSAEILVVDVVSAESPATDTPWGCKTIRVPWEGDFAELKNRAADAATGEWILWLSAGELFLGDFVEPFITFLAVESDLDEQYYMMVEQPPAENGSTEQIADVRLTPRRDGLVFDGRIRENTLRSAASLGITLSSAPGRILQPAAGQTAEARRRAAQRNLTLAELALEEADLPQPRFLLAKADALAGLGRIDESARTFREALEECEPGTPEMLEAHYGIVTLHETDPSGLQQQVKAAAEALAAFPSDAQLLCAMGTLMQQQGRLDLAARAFEAVLTHGVVEARTWHSTEVFDVAAICLSVCHQKQENEEAARRVLEEALQSRPEANRIRRRLIEMAIAANEEDTAVELLEDMICTADEREALESIVRGACRASAGEYVAALELLQPVYVGGCTDRWCLRWLVVTLIGGGKPEVAAKVIARWRQIDPASAEAKSYEAQIAKIVEETTGSAPDVRIDDAGAPNGNYAGNPNAENVRR